MRVRLWGVRGSTPVPGPAVAGFGGNTPCVQVTAADGTELILDAGTGIRELGEDIVGAAAASTSSSHTFMSTTSRG